MCEPEVFRASRDCLISETLKLGSERPAAALVASEPDSKTTHLAAERMWMWQSLRAIGECEIGLRHLLAPPRVHVMVGTGRVGGPIYTFLSPSRRQNSYGPSSSFSR